MMQLIHLLRTGIGKRYLITNTGRNTIVLKLRHAGRRVGEPHPICPKSGIRIIHPSLHFFPLDFSLTFTMQASMMSNAAASALRIYLTYSLHETEELLRELNFRANAVSPALCQGTASLWMDTAEYAQRVIRYITNCQCDDEMHGFFARGFHGLSAISAAQDALSETLVRARANTYTNNRPMPTSLMIAGHTFRAKFLVNSIVAMNANDYELSDLWIQAAQHVIQTSNSSALLTSNPHASRINLAKAQGFESGSYDQNDTLVVELGRVAARFYRCAAARSTGSTSSELRRVSEAATTYENTLKLHLEAHVQVSLAAAPLWQSAVSTMRLAADMYAAQETDESLIEETVAAANKLAVDARLIPGLETEQEQRLAELSETAAKVATTKHPVATSLWSALKAELEKSHALTARYMQLLLQGEGQSPSTALLKMQIDAGFIKVNRDTARKVEASIQSSAFFKKKAQQALTSPHAQLHALLQRCWTLAATHMDNAVQVYGEYVVNGSVQQVRQVVVQQQDARASAANEAVYVAEYVLGRAANHLNAAHGAEAAGRDPREAKYWRGAADSLVQTAEHVCDSIESDMVNLTEAPYFNHMFVVKKLEEETSLVTSAEYMRHAHQHQTSPTLPHSARIADLYEEVARLSQNKGERGSARRRAEAAISFVVQYIDNLQTQHLSEREIKLTDRGCKYAAEVCRAAQSNSPSVDKWSIALASVKHAISALEHDPYKVNLHFARAALYEFAAKESSNTFASKERSSIYVRAAEEVEAAMQVLSTCPALMAYRVALAELILCRPGNGMEELTAPHELLEIEANEVLDDVLCLLASHARACRLTVMCDRRSSSSRYTEDERKAWKLAWDQAYLLTAHYQSQAKAKYLSVAPTYPESLNEAQEVAVTCYMGAAMSVRDRAKAALWHKAVLECKKTDLLSHSNVEGRRTGVALTKVLICEARAAATVVAAEAVLPAPEVGLVTVPLDVTQQSSAVVEKEQE